MSAWQGEVGLARFAAALSGAMGMHFDESKFDAVGQAVARRMEANRQGALEYLGKLSAGPGIEELESLARELTVTETYFMRNAEQIDAFIEAALPGRIEAAGGARPVSVLSAGCSSGEEPYSLAIAARERCPQWAASVAIQAFDLNPAMLRKAREGRYGEWSLRSCPEPAKRRWFAEDGDARLLSEQIRKAVSFESRNLACDDPAFWLPGRFDIVFCRNILMYFSPEKAREAVARLARSLAPGGYLFLGHAETMRGLSDAFHVRHTHGAFYYQRKEGAAEEPASAAGAPARAPLPELWPEGLAAGAGWAQAIAEASERIRSLVPPGAGLGGAGARAEPGPPEGDADGLLLQAVAASQGGDLARAEEACRALLRADDMSAGAHHVLALCSEGRGDWAQAIEQDRIAMHLDPSFAMASLHMGLLTRRHGDRAEALAELARAIGLLSREDPSRILMFGGGFKREALVGLCAAEMSALGGAP